MENTSKEAAFVSKLIAEYYKSSESIAPDKINSREFGAGTFERKIAYRHMLFPNELEFKKFLVEKAPPYLSYSAAYYKRPDGRPMENKGWLGAELVFDLDVTDMNLTCQWEHGRSWVCQICLDSVKGETIKLIEDFLIPDFGFSEKELEINFSGNRGYHVHVKKESVLKLDGEARKQVSDYISGNGVEIESLFPTIGQRGVKLIGPKPTDKGWKGKIARDLLSNIEKGTDNLLSMGIDKATAKNLYNKRALIAMGINNGNWDMVYIKNKAEFWKKILTNQAIVQSDRIDKNVTKDPTHLIRLPGSIHGETGLTARKVASLSELAKFDPMKEAIAFKKSEITVKTLKTPKLIMNGQEFGPFDGEKTTLPVYAGIYLALKGLAQI
ncbi:MAG TPA: DNA primase catalytic subunit PriS [Candidatus Saccharimonadales bacterium]|nr:DNA primase catalytic subunit PriS [Candidatus Saccharimonadales bacterium]